MVSVASRCIIVNCRSETLGAERDADTSRVPRHGIQAVARDVRPAPANGYAGHVSPLTPLIARSTNGTLPLVVCKLLISQYAILTSHLLRRQLRSGQRPAVRLAQIEGTVKEQVLLGWLIRHDCSFEHLRARQSSPRASRALLDGSGTAVVTSIGTVASAVTQFRLSKVMLG